MKILVIGASGFIGRNFIINAFQDWQITGIFRSNPDLKQFAVNFPKLSVIECDLSDSSEAKNKLSAISGYFDVGLFVWGNSNIGYSCENPSGDLNANVDSLINLVTNVRFGKFIFMSSGTVYMGQKGQVDHGKNLVPPSPYGISKLASELYLRFFAEKTNQIGQYINVRFFGAYGPMEPSRKIFSNLIRKFVVEKKNDYTLFGDGTNVIDAMYIDDAIDALNKMILSDKGNLTVDLCKGEPLTLKELVLKVAVILGVKDLELKTSGESKEFISFYASPKRAEELFGFRAHTPMEEGIIKLRNYLLGENVYV